MPLRKTVLLLLAALLCMSTLAQAAQQLVTATERLDAATARYEQASRRLEELVRRMETVDRPARPSAPRALDDTTRNNGDQSALF